MKKNTKLFFIRILFAISISPLILYFVKFHGSLSVDQNDWIAFGTIWGSVFTGISILLLVIENLKNKENQIFQKIIDIHDIQLKRITENDTRKKIKEKDIESIENGNDSFFSYFNNLMKEELMNGIVSYLFEVLETNKNFLENENLKEFFFKYIADQIEIPEDIIKTYWEKTPSLDLNNKEIIYKAWDERKNENISKEYIHTFSYQINEDIPIGMITQFPHPDENFEYLLEHEEYEKNNIISLYSEAFENTSNITTYLLDSYFYTHINAVLLLSKNSQKLNEYFELLSPDEKKTITYYLLIKDDKKITDLHIRNHFFTSRKASEIKYITSKRIINTSFYEDSSKYIFGINSFDVLKQLLLKN